MASTSMSTARIANARPLAPKAPFSASRPARAVRVVAAAQVRYNVLKNVNFTFIE